MYDVSMIYDGIYERDTCLSCIMPTRGDREPSSGSFHGAMCRLLKASIAAT